MAKITDPLLEPYFIGKDTHCYTVYEVVTPQAKYLEKGSEGKDYEKPQGHYSSFGAALQKVAKEKLNNEKEHYTSIREYVERWDKLLIELKKITKLQRTMNLEATFNAVIVKPLEQEEETYGSIVVPDIGKDKNEHGEVISVGPGQHTISGTFIKTTINVGDIVVLPTQGFTKLEHNGEEFYVGPENQILAKVKREVVVEDILTETTPLDDDHLISEEEMNKLEKELNNE